LFVNNYFNATAPFTNLYILLSLPSEFFSFYRVYSVVIVAIVIVIAISKLLKRHWEGHQLIHERSLNSEGFVLRIVHGSLRSDFERIRRGRVAVKAGVVYGESGKTEYQMSQGMSSWRDDTSNPSDLRISELRRHIVPETWCSDWYGAVGELEMSSDWRSREGNCKVSVCKKMIEIWALLQSANIML